MGSSGEASEEQVKWVIENISLSNLNINKKKLVQNHEAILMSSHNLPFYD